MGAMGAAATLAVARGGETASSTLDAAGDSPAMDFASVGSRASVCLSVIGSTPSGEGKSVTLVIDAGQAPLEIDAAGDPLLVQAGVIWIGRSASEVV